MPDTPLAGLLLLLVVVGLALLVLATAYAVFMVIKWITRN
jgi:hypothetical protein